MFCIDKINYSNDLKSCIGPQFIDIYGASIKDGCENILTRAFFDCKNLEQIFLPSSVNVICEAAFLGCENLKYINLENTNIKILPREVFKKCTSLKSLAFPDTVKIIESGALAGIDIEKIILPKNVKSLPYYLFENSNIKEVVLPDNLERIKNFIVGSKVEKIVVGKQNKEILKILEKMATFCKVELIFSDLDHLLDENKSFKEINNFYKENEER